MTLVQDNRHRAFVRFIRTAMDAIADKSKDDLVSFRNVAMREMPSVVPLIDEYIRLAERADTDVGGNPPDQWRLLSSRLSGPRGGPGARMHLFDLLREKRIFPSNSDLANFAVRILPDIRGHRFDKMSRGDIAARIVEYLESKDKRTRETLEASMRDAFASPKVKPSDRKSFMSKWEAIIKGIEL